MIPYAKVPDNNLQQEICEEVRKLCAGFPGEYWRELDRETAYPTEFVVALSKAVCLARIDE